MGKSIQEDHYDPFGMKLGGLGFIADAENKFLYQGKELNNEGIDFRDNSQTDIYLNWYDFEARNYDPQIGRWHVPDPANQYPSPYIGMGNNPIRMVDPNGMAAVGCSQWVRQFLEDPDGHGGHLGPLISRNWRERLVEGAAARVEAEARIEQAYSNINSFENYVEQLQDWYAAKEQARLAAEAIEAYLANAAPQGDAPQEPGEAAAIEGTSDENWNEIQLDIANASQTGLMNCKLSGGDNDGLTKKDELLIPGSFSSSWENFLDNLDFFERKFQAGAEIFFLKFVPPVVIINNLNTIVAGEENFRPANLDTWDRYIVPGVSLMLEAADVPEYELFWDLISKPTVPWYFDPTKP